LGTSQTLLSSVGRLCEWPGANRHVAIPARLREPTMSG
jgi:hypothetical protein